MLFGQKGHFFHLLPLFSSFFFMAPSVSTAVSLPVTSLLLSTHFLQLPPTTEMFLSWHPSSLSRLSTLFGPLSNVTFPDFARSSSASVPPPRLSFHSLPLTPKTSRWGHFEGSNMVRGPKILDRGSAQFLEVDRCWRGRIPLTGPPAVLE